MPKSMKEWEELHAYEMQRADKEHEMRVKADRIIGELQHATKKRGKEIKVANEEIEHLKQTKLKLATIIDARLATLRPHIYRDGYEYDLARNRRIEDPKPEITPVSDEEKLLEHLRMVLMEPSLADLKQAEAPYNYAQSRRY